MTSEKKAVPVASIGSPSTTDELTLDILSSAIDRRLVGSLLYFDVVQEGRLVRQTGQITGVEMRNQWHEQTQWKNYIKEKGEISFLSGKQDVRTAMFSPGATFSRPIDDHTSSAPEGWRYEVLGTVPAAGTPVYRLDQETLDELVASQAKDVFQLGRAYGDDKLRIPMSVKHFGDPKTGGQGEATHILLAGKTGSGKSTMAKFLLSGFLRHEDMAVLIIDPKGEFADEIAGYAVGDSGLPFRGILKGFNRSAARYGITQVRFEGYELFENVLVSLGLDKDLNIRGVDNKEELALAITEIIKSGELRLNDLRGRDKLVTILETLRGAAVEDEDDCGYLPQIYKSKEGQDSLRRLINKIIENPQHRIFGTWDFLAYLFEQGDGSRPTIGQIAHQLMESKTGERPLIVLDLSVSGNRRDFNDLGEEFKSLQDANEERDLFTDALQKKILFRIVSDMRRLCETIVSERSRLGDKSNVNTLVLFEEAHRYAPRQVASDDEDGKKLKAKLIEAVRETRKYGLGWFFIDQTIGGIDKEITQQVRTFFMGYGLTMGEELSSVKELVGGDPRDITLYRSFKDPASYGKPSEKRFPWMAFGPVSPMASNHPMFLTAFQGEDFVTHNRLPVDRSDRPLRLPPQTLDARKRKVGNIRSVSMADLPENLLD
jgi:energy-coupling factor transporter ATP-binding protein EcfA2